MNIRQIIRIVATDVSDEVPRYCFKGLDREACKRWLLLEYRINHHNTVSSHKSPNTLFFSDTIQNLKSKIQLQDQVY